MSADLTRLTPCQHTPFSHLFSNVLCPRQATSLKVTKAVLGLFVVLGVSWVAYSYFRSDLNERISKRLPLVDHSEKGKEALTFARELLAKHPEIQPAKVKKQPVNEEISKLLHLLNTICWQALEEALKSNQVEAWSQQSVLEAADRCMKVAYATSCLTLEDLKAFKEQNKDLRPRVTVESLKNERVKCTHEEASFIDSLTRQDSYQYRTFFDCPQFYHWLRGGVVWDPNLEYAGGQGGVDYPKTLVGEAHYKPYYCPDTLQNSWNQLYNEYCDRVNMHVPLDALEKGDSRFTKWIKKDTGPGSFNRSPTTLPT